jgi:hypothetical protein
MFGDTITVYFENHIKTQINSGLSAEFQYVKEDGAYSNYWALKG